MDPSVADRFELDVVRIRRAELGDSLAMLERALAVPPASRPDSTDVGWNDAVHAALAQLGDDFGAHIEVTEGAGGLHESILGGDLRLANAVQSLAAEHGRITDEIAVLVADSAARVPSAGVDTLRQRARSLLELLIRHRQRGADLIYEAFETDIGGGD